MQWFQYDMITVMQLLLILIITFFCHGNSYNNTTQTMKRM